MWQFCFVVKSNSRYSLVHLFPTSSSKSDPTPVFYNFCVKPSSRYSLVYILPTPSPKVLWGWQFFTIFTWNRARYSLVHFLLTTFADQGPKPRKQRPYFGDHGSRVRECFQGVMMWLTWWHDDVVAMTVRMLAMTIVHNLEVFKLNFLWQLYIYIIWTYMDNIWIYIIIYDISENIYIILYQYLSNICKHFWRKFEISQEQSLTRFVSWPRANHVSCTAKGPSWCPKAAGTLWGASRKGPRFSESLTMSYLNGLVEEKQEDTTILCPHSMSFVGSLAPKKSMLLWNHRTNWGI